MDVFVYFSVITMTQLVSTLLKHNKIDQTMYDRVLQFVAQNRFDKQVPVAEKKAKAVSIQKLF